jgi:glycerol-3-phosphate O-acyltransferase
MQFLQVLDEAIFQNKLPQELGTIIRDYSFSYVRGIQQAQGDLQKADEILKRHLGYVIEQCAAPYIFPSYHVAHRSPIDYMQFGIDFMEPLVMKDQSFVKNLERVDTIQQQLRAGENVILFGNHQIEPDPQAIVIMLKDTHPDVAEKMIFVAGHRVTTDPFGIPFSLGCNLLCIYSKKHIENPPEKKEEKLLYNQRTMNAMKELLAEGGHCIYVAPSGGRDRPNEQGDLVPADFDPRSIEMFRLMAKQSHRPTHFYPLALSTYGLMPPPPRTFDKIAEPRTSNYSPIRICFGEELSLDNMPGMEGLDKHQCREVRAKCVWEIVNRDYKAIRL